MFEETVRDLYELLRNGKYEEIVQITGGVRLSSNEIKYAISEYGRRLAPYPKTIDLDVIEVTGSDPKKWSVVAPVFTEEEGLSDLNIELTIIDDGHPNLKIEFDDLHVL